MNSHQIHARNCCIIKAALENAGYKCKTTSLKGVDFIVTPPGGGKTFKMQVRSRLYLIEEYCGKQMRIAFPDEENDRCVYLYELDAMVQAFCARWKNKGKPIPKSWDPHGVYHIDPTPGWVQELNPPILRHIASRP